MKICFFTHYSEMLGANHSLLQLIQYLSTQDEIEIQVVLPANGAMGSNLKSLNIPHIIIPFKYSYRSINLNWKGRLIAVPELIRDYLRIINDAHRFKKFDVIYSNSSVISHGLILSRILGIKHIWHLREYGLEDYSIVPIYGMKIQAYLARKSERLVFISEHLKNSKENWFKLSENAPVIYNGVPVSNNVAKEIDFSSITICFAGLMSENKNAIEGLDLIESLKSENIHATYFIYSTMKGKYADRFMHEVNIRKLNDNVKIMGFVENLCDSIKNHHFLLMPSRNEAMGRVSIEAMSVGVPVIGYNAGGTAELFKDGFSGVYYKDITEVKTKIKTMSKSEYATMSQNAYNTANTRFSDEVYGKQIYMLCKELIEKG